MIMCYQVPDAINIFSSAHFFACSQVVLPHGNFWDQFEQLDWRQFEGSFALLMHR